MIETLRNSITSYRAARVGHQSRYSGALQDVPPGLFRHWTRSAGFEFEGIPRDAFFFARALDGLISFFDCVRHSSRPCGLPSRAADSVWHAWIAFAPAGLEHFCVRHFGRTIAHVEAADMHGNMDQALAACLVQARILERLPVAGRNVPRLFALDRTLRMPDGFSYTLANGELAFSRLDGNGHAGGGLQHAAGLTALALLSSGLISHGAYDEQARRAKQDGGCAGSSGGSDSGCDGGGGDGGAGGCGGGGCGGS